MDLREGRRILVDDDFAADLERTPSRFSNSRTPRGPSCPARPRHEGSGPPAPIALRSRAPRAGRRSSRSRRSSAARRARRLPGERRASGRATTRDARAFERRGEEGDRASNQESGSFGRSRSSRKTDRDRSGRPQSRRSAASELVQPVMPGFHDGRRGHERVNRPGRSDHGRDGYRLRARPMAGQHGESAPRSGSPAATTG